MNKSISVFALFSLLLWPAGNSATEQKTGNTAAPSKALPRFHQVTDGVFRGGQPTDEGFALLKERGIRTVVNLRQENGEESLVRQLGMNYIHVPLSIHWWNDDIPDSAIQRVLSVMRDPAQYPVFIHCRRGADRTGAMVGAFRIVEQGWTGREAYKEAREIGMRWWYRGIKKSLETFDATRFAKAR